ncbi:MAG: MATE family efflux transporter, partial [SAR324 cluster bacterium]|nr:MATE family efflux transporter [SAR324 cluster bacterium]
MFSKQFEGPGGISQLLYIAIPMVVSQACETIMMFTDRLFLSQVSPMHMSASMSGGLTAFMFSTFFIGLTGYATPLVAQYLGSGNKKICGVVIFQALI